MFLKFNLAFNNHICNAYNMPVTVLNTLQILISFNLAKYKAIRSKKYKELSIYVLWQKKYGTSSKIDLILIFQK